MGWKRHVVYEDLSGIIDFVIRLERIFHLVDPI